MDPDAVVLRSIQLCRRQEPPLELKSDLVCIKFF